MKIVVSGTDIETTGFLEPEHRIIEMNVQQYEMDTAQPEVHRLIREKTWRINPGRSIPKKSTEFHGIVESDLIGCPALEDVSAEIYEWLDAADIVVAHNGLEFDFPFIVQEFERIGQELPDFEPFDTMQDGRWATFFGKIPSLKELCFACGVEYDTEKAHAADYDVKVMMDCFFFAAARDFYTLPTLADMQSSGV